MKLSADAQKELDDLTYFLLSYTDHILTGTLRVEMTPLTKHPYAIRFFHPEINDSTSETERLARLFNKIDVTYLRDLMVDKEKGAWLSVSFEIDCDANWNVDIEDKELKIVFNYDKRFNVLSDDWSYDPAQLTFPTADYFMEDFQKHPRSRENYPKWLPTLIAEEKKEREVFAAADLNEVFRKNFAVRPEMVARYAEAVNSKSWVSLWEHTAKSFERLILTEKYRARPFIDPRYAFLKRDSVMWNSRDLSDLIAKKHAENNQTVFDAQIYNGSNRLAGFAANSGLNFDLNDLDPDDVRRAFSDTVYEVVMLQNKQRFAELFNN